MIKRIISGGQTGVDRAALDVAIKLGIPHGGWVPKGGRAENGKLSSKYQLTEMSTPSYPKRTEKNILDSDGTLIISHGRLAGGSALTRKLAKKHGRPWVHVDLDKGSLSDAAGIVRAWIEQNDIEILNVAGPRASKDPSIYNSTVKILQDALEGYLFYEDLGGTIAEPPCYDPAMPTGFSLTIMMN
jgi:hypothetical protein